MHSHSIKWKATISIAGLGLVVALVLALTIGSSGATADAGATGAAGTAPSADGGPSGFGALQPAASENLADVPPSIAAVLTELPATDGGQGKGVLKSLAIAPGGSAASEIVVAEVGDTLCVLATGTEYQGAAVGSCSSIAEAEAGEGFVSIHGLAKDSVRVIGVAPDGVSSVSFDAGDNGTAESKVPVTGNVYQADLGKAPTTATGVRSSGEVAFRTAIPLADGLK